MSSFLALIPSLLVSKEDLPYPLTFDNDPQRPNGWVLGGFFHVGIIESSNRRP